MPGFYQTHVRKQTDAESDGYRTMSDVHSIEMQHRLTALSHGSAGDWAVDGNKQTLAPPAQPAHDASPDHWNLYRNSAKNNVNRLYQPVKHVNYQPRNQHK